MFKPRPEIPTDYYVFICKFYLQVRASSLGIAVSLTQSAHGCAVVLSHMRQVSHGLIGVGLGFLLEFSEACIVREQVSILYKKIFFMVVLKDKFQFIFFTGSISFN